MSDLEFVNELPPRAPSTGRPSKWAPIVEKLAAEPGHWAVVERTAKRGTANGCQGQLRRRGCEASIRRQGAEFVVYARFPEAA